MNRTPRTPLRSRAGNIMTVSTPQLSLSRELKQVLNERNLLTAKTRKKVCSMLDNMTPQQHNELDKRRSLRLQAIEEIVTSEKSYLKQLETLMNYFIVPLKQRSIIDTAIHTTLFGQVEIIYNLNGELLSELEADLNNVSSAFLKLAPFFKLYSVYAFDYKNALLILQDLTSKNPVFRKFIQETETRPEVQAKLNSLMIVPIQRVPRYRLLLQQVLLYTSPVDPDFKILKESVKEVENTVAHINSVIEDQEVTQILLNVQNSLTNRLPHIVKPSRKVIKEGVLHKVARNGDQVKRYCILMSDIFMYCKILKDRTKNTQVENSLDCCCIFPLKKCKVYELFPGNFKISCQGDGIILCTTDRHVGQSWLSSLRDAIELHIQCRKTLRKESSKRTPMRRKDLKNFDADCILSPNKRKCDYETVFRCKTDGSDSESDEVTTSCFNLKAMVPKNRSASQPKQASNTTSKESNITISMNASDNLFKVPATPPPRPIQTKLPWSNSKSDSKPTSTTHDFNDTNSNKSDDYDPTYGFISRFSDTKSYFRTHNVDSIPNSVNPAEILLGCESTPVLDMLFPLRHGSSTGSTGSDKSDSSWLHKRYFSDKDKENISSCEEPTLPKKRVKFEDMLDEEIEYRDYSTVANRRSVKPAPYNFSGVINSNTDNRISLTQRIVDFFTNMF